MTITILLTPGTMNNYYTCQKRFSSKGSDTTIATLTVQTSTIIPVRRDFRVKVQSGYHNSNVNSTNIKMNVLSFKDIHLID